MVEVNGIEPMTCRYDRSPVAWRVKLGYIIPRDLSSIRLFTVLKYLSLFIASERVRNSS